MIVKALLLYILYSIGVDYLYGLLHGYYYMQYTPSSPSLLSLISATIVAPLWEEALYRYGPLTIAKYFSPSLLLPTAVMSSMVFGWGHDMGQMGIIHQGVFGLVLSYVFIKRGYLYSVTLHSLWNLSCLLFFDSLLYY